MPAISSGIFGFPKDRCAKILVEESKTFLQDSNNNNSNNNDAISALDTVEFYVSDDETRLLQESIRAYGTILKGSGIITHDIVLVMDWTGQIVIDSGPIQ